MLLLLLIPSLAICQPPSPRPHPTAQTKLEYFLKLTDTLRLRARNPGMAMAIIDNNQLLYQGGLGYRNLDKQLPVTTNTLFEIGSCTKAFTGVVAAQLVQEKALAWDDKVVQHLPEFKLADPYATANATLTDLLTHRVGVYQHYYLQYGPRFSRNEVLKMLPFLSFNGTFREKFIYNNLLYTAAGILEERVTHTPWQDLVKTRIFAPLGMTQSFATFEEFQRYGENTVSYRNDGYTVIPPSSIDAAAPAGAISSTLNDMTKWLTMLVNKGTLDGKEFLTPRQFAHLTSPLTVRNAAEEIFYGIGWDIDARRNTIYHDGRTGGQSARIVLAPQSGFGIVIMCNQQTELQNLLTRYATNIFLDNNYEKLADFEQYVIDKNNPPAAAQAPKASLIQDPQVLKKASRYVGTYSHPAYGTITISKAPKNQLAFAYYDFKGPVKHNAGLSFTALTTHFTGNDTFDFRILEGPAQEVTGIEVQFPYSQPLVFTKAATLVLPN
ncbi:serine hydrolase [Hymenobacter algoricola]|uniref:Serine hydrolase n=1 Tax=Hymenobacter algoricola TaxID=486267 RepID=A0ABP7N7T3_9BACT